MSCAKLNFCPIVPNYYDTAQKTIFYSGNWNSISNAKLVEYLFKAFEISENQISKDEFVKILLENKEIAHWQVPEVAPVSVTIEKEANESALHPLQYIHFNKEITMSDADNRIDATLPVAGRIT